MNRSRLILLSGLWTIFVAWCQVTGWALSGLRCLNFQGYAISLFPLILVFWIFVFSCKSRINISIPKFRVLNLFNLYRLKKQFRGFSLHKNLFVFLCYVILLSSIINNPFGWDANSYRIPRVLQWLQEQKWLWLRSGDSRLDISSVAQEWQFAPIFAFFNSDRLIFLVNYLPYLLFPGLLYLAMRFIKVSRMWSLLLMWLIPLGYCFSLSAGGIQNDGIGGIHAVAALAFLNRQAISMVGRKWSISLSILNLCLLSGLKLSNAPLAGVMLLYVLWNFRNKIFVLLFPLHRSIIVAICCIASSILPMLLINTKNEGSWSGDPSNRYKCRTINYIASPIVNTGFLITDALTPNPFADKLNNYASLAISNSSFVKWLVSNYSLAKTMRFSFFPYEGAAGPGFPILVIFPIFLILSCPGKISELKFTGSRALLALALTAYLIYTLSIASNASARISAPYFVIISITLAGYVSSIGRNPKLKLNQLILIGSHIVVCFSLFVMTSRPLLTTKIYQKLNEKSGNVYELHRYCSCDIGSFTNKYKGTIYYVTHWGAITHRLFAPYRNSGKSIEIGSSIWYSCNPKGEAYVIFTRGGAIARYNMRLDDLAKKYNATLIDFDKNAPDAAREHALYLYKFPDISMLPPPVSERTYFIEYWKSSIFEL